MSKICFDLVLTFLLPQRLHPLKMSVSKIMAMEVLQFNGFLLLTLLLIHLC